MAPGDSFHFRVQRGQGPWSTALAASTKGERCMEGLPKVLRALRGGGAWRRGTIGYIEVRDGVKNWPEIC